MRQLLAWSTLEAGYGLVRRGGPWGSGGKTRGDRVRVHLSTGRLDWSVRHLIFLPTAKLKQSQQWEPPTKRSRNMVGRADCFRMSRPPRNQRPVRDVLKDFPHPGGGRIMGNSSTRAVHATKTSVRNQEYSR